MKRHISAVGAGCESLLPRSAAGHVVSCRHRQAHNIDLIILPEQPDCKRPLVVAVISAHRSV